MSSIFYENIEENTINNDYYRKVVYTGKMQFVYMNILPLDNIHKEIHLDHDQFIRIESGEGIAIINNKKYKLYDGIGIIIPAGTEHEIINTSDVNNLKLYTIYTPPEHKPNTIQKYNPDKEIKNFKENKSYESNIFEEKYLKYKKKYLNFKKFNKK